MVNFQLMSSDYIINSNNNTLSIEYLSTNYVNTLTQGTWTASTYATQLQTDLNTAGNWNINPGLTWTVTYSSSKNEFTIAASAAVKLNFNISTKLAPKLGFSKNQTISLSNHTSDISVQFFNSRYYDVRINELQKDFSEGLNKCFARIYNTVQPNELLTYYKYQYDNIEHLYNKGDVITNHWNIKLYDENNDIIDLNNSEWNMIIKLHCL